MISATVLWIAALVLVLASLLLVVASVIGRRLGDARRQDERDGAALRTATLIAFLAGLPRTTPRPSASDRQFWIAAARDLSSVIEGPDRDRLDQLISTWLADRSPPSPKQAR
jgi:hypothetical protein